MRLYSDHLFSVRDRLLFVMIVLLPILIYWPGLSGGFVFDDFGNLVDNSAFAPGAVAAHFWAAVWSSGSGPTHRPLSMLTFALQVLFTGLDPWPLKFVNVLIHTVNGVLIFVLSRMVLRFSFEKHLVGRRWLITPELLALFVTAAWLFSPMQLTAVLYVIQRMESLSVLFVLSGLLMYWQGRQRLILGQRFAWVLIFLGLTGGTLLAILAKESGVMLPLYAFLLEWLILRGKSFDGYFESKLIWLFVVVLLIPGLAGLAYTLPSALNNDAYAMRPFDLAQRLWTEGRVMVDYLHWLIAPTSNELSLYHDDIAISTGWFAPWTTAASWILIVALIGSALWLRRRAPLYAMGILWFFGGQMLVSTYVPLELAYEHRNYLPSWGVYMALFGVLVAWQPVDIERRRLLRTLAVSGITALVVLFVAFTALRAQIWGNPYRLSYFEATTHPDSARANYDLARVMMIQAPNPESASFQMGLQQMQDTAKLKGANLQAEQAMIFMSAKNDLKVDPRWWVSMRAKVGRQSFSQEDVSALYSLITCGTNDVCKYTEQDRVQLGKTLAFVVARYPKDAGVITLYANYAANVIHNFPLAYRLMQRAVALMPSQFNYWNNLVTMQIAMGDVSSAHAGIERMRELNAFGRHDAEISALRVSLEKKRNDGSEGSRVLK